MNKLTKQRFSELIQNFELVALFNALGWDNFHSVKKVDIKDVKYTLSGIAKKKDFCILECPIEDGQISEAAIRKQFEKPVSKLYYDHLLVFTDKNKTTQYWQLPLREEGKVKRLVTFVWRKGQDAEGLYQKFRNIVFTLDEEENITLLDVKERVNASLTANSEKVTKKFYIEFTKQHNAFLAFIKGIDDVLPNKDNFNKKWYASLMMNRLMFCYFIQKKRFLDWNDNYLQDKLNECKKLKGQDNFYGFYRSFLLELFHDELANPEEKRRKKKTPVEFGNIPYLNGGLFEVHYLEETYKGIAITDEAFQNIFRFFDEWEWHLDTRISASGRDINPDVIGYIFEKYINNRADMGAYYTKEDITDYIGKNTIIPFLLEKVKTYHPAPFAPGGGFWQYLQDSGDEYIYDAVKKGGEACKTMDEVAIPENIKIGIDTKKPNLLERRKNWNTTTPEAIGLPTEIWRETIARLERYFELKRKISKGEITEINDFITYNLNIRHLVQDYIDQTADKKFIRQFYKALTSITILDPTCGSGAFLFAALNILEPLYEVCLQRMEEFHSTNPKTNKDFEDHLLPLLSGQHPSRSYYIYKTIILNNLYGIDLMKEAVEIAKLRLFLKLVAEVDPSRRKKNYGLEPLPDIDFNIRSGNTLVGFATEGQLEEVVREHEGPLTYKERYDELKMECDAAAGSFNHFKRMQMAISSDSFVIRKAKQDYAEAIKTLDEKLNRYLADTYGLGAKTQWKSQKEKEKAYQNWKDSHQPFHWFAEFYEIISNGGFDVVIGNPPYVEYSKVKKDYQIKNYETESCGNLYANVMEISMRISKTKSKNGFIVPLASFSTKRMLPLRTLYIKNGNFLYLSNYEATSNPSTIFIGVKIQLSIVILDKNSNNNCEIFTTFYNRSYSLERNLLFNKVIYQKPLIHNNYITRVNNNIEISILNKLFTQKNMGLFLVGENKVFYRNMGNFFFKLAFKNEPIYYKNGIKESSSTVSFLSTNSISDSCVVIGIINSSLFYYYWILFSDCYHLSKSDIFLFPFDFSMLKTEQIEKMISLSNQYSDEIEKNAIWQSENKKDGTTKKYRRYFPQNCKHISDAIDHVLASHYGFTEEELDFIINYDIKYRMGGELEEL